MVGAHRAVDRVQHAVVGLLRERLLDDRREHVAEAADVGREVVPAVGAVPVLAQVLARVVDAVGDLDRAELRSRSGCVARVPRTSVRNCHSGSVSIAELTPMKPPPARNHASKAASSFGPSGLAVRVQEENGVVAREPVLVELARAVGDDDVEVLLARELADLPARRRRRWPPATRRSPCRRGRRTRPGRPARSQRGPAPCWRRPVPPANEAFSSEHSPPLNGISRGRPTPSCQEVVPVRLPCASPRGRSRDADDRTRCELSRHPHLQFCRLPPARERTSAGPERPSSLTACNGSEGTVGGAIARDTTTSSAGLQEKSDAWRTMCFALS